jgi:hypothetical protein
MCATSPPQPAKSFIITLFVLGLAAKVTNENFFFDPAESHFKKP